DAPPRVQQLARFVHLGGGAGNGEVAPAAGPAPGIPGAAGMRRPPLTAGTPPAPPDPPGSACPGPAAGRRPSMSSRRSAGVRSITAVKLTTSLAAVRPMIPARRAARAGRGRLAAAAAPSMAPTAFP